MQAGDDEGSAVLSAFDKATDLSSWTVSKLKKLLDVKGVDYPRSGVKAAYVKMAADLKTVERPSADGK